MPLLESKIRIPNGHILVWQLQESAGYLKDTLPEWLDLTEYDRISHPQKQREWLAGRHLFVALCEVAGIPFQGIWKSPDGKPFLLGSTAHISLSHSEHLVAAALHFTAAVGIDLELPREQLVRIARKFLSDDELEQTGTDTNLLCHYWSAKEAAYKLVGERNISFRDHIRVVKTDAPAEWSASILSRGTTTDAVIRFEKIQEYYLAIALSAQTD